jgi:ASC-1-like (ASCH) protein
MSHLLFSSKKVKVENFWAEFQKHQVDGYIGDPRGEDAYGSLRVSSDKQTNDFKTGIERQIESLHLAAKRYGVRISWDMLYGDDESGYILDRPSLKELLTETAKNPRARHIVFESISRMSRASQWQQGWLLEQFEDYRHMKVHFFDAADTPIERLIKGYLADEGMKQQIKLMKAGRQKKAEKGFVDKGMPPFGYRIGAKEGFDPTKVREYATYIALWEGDPSSPNACAQYGEAKIVREIFQLVAYKGKTTRAVANIINEKYGPPEGAARWYGITVSRMIQNTAYYGMYAKGRYEFFKENQIQPDGTIAFKTGMRQRPQEEWTMVPVERIVSKELWDLANIMLGQNKKVSFRNSRSRDYLLTGLLRCWDCGFAWRSIYIRPRKFQKTKTTYYYYQCSTAKGNYKKERGERGITCSQNISIRCEVLEDAVWDIVRQVMDSPDVLLRFFDSQLENSENQEKKSQIDYIRRQIEGARLTDKKDRELFDKGFMKVEVYGPKYKETSEQIARWEASIDEIEKTLTTKDDVEQSKAEVMEIYQSAKEYEFDGGEIPFEVKRTLIKLCVKEIYLDGRNQRFRLVGRIGDYTRSLNGENEGGDGNGGGFLKPSPG